MKQFVNTIDIEAPVHEVYLALRTLDAYPAWLGRSVVYRGTRVPRPTSSDVYEDTTTIGRMRGQLVDERPDRELHFHQAVRSGRVDADIRYAVDPAGPVTRVTRVGEVTTHGAFRAMQPVLVRMAAAESRRTMRALKAHVEHPEQ
ncbi:SRPBCC family protein [Leifsonia sp. 2MCAF36]|uniref:SRPBCC family protein n=1 Tax=Leifsonia sp. 2MCAF36 TaxID=3232988 RepID=UPI003F9EAF07